MKIAKILNALMGKVCRGFGHGDITSMDLELRFILALLKGLWSWKEKAIATPQSRKMLNSAAEYASPWTGVYTCEPITYALELSPVMDLVKIRPILR